MGAESAVVDVDLEEEGWVCAVYIPWVGWASSLAA